MKEESEKAGLKRLIHVNVWQNHHNKIISLQLNFFLKNSKNKDKKKQRSWQLVPSLHGKLIRKKWELSDFIFLGSKITVDGDCSHEIKRLASWKKSYDKPRQHIEKQKPKKKKRCHFADKVLYSQNYGFSSMDMKVGHKEDRRTDTFKLWCWRLESPLDSKEIKPVNPKGNPP